MNHFRPVPPLRWILTLLSMGVFFVGLGCQDATDWIRNWGEVDRRNPIPKISNSELEQWERDLSISRERATELHKNIELLVQESNFQARLSWKIARAYMNQGRYRMADLHMRDAFQGGLVDRSGKPIAEDSYFAKALPFYREALTRQSPNVKLVFDAGLCYANASRSLGWNKDYWETAILLMQQAAKMNPADQRPLYEMALLYGKVDDPQRRNLDLAVELLNQIIKKDGGDIPARFARAHMLVLAGDLPSAREEYRSIENRLLDMHSSGLLGGEAKDNQKYIQAQKNGEMIDKCISGTGLCEVLSVQ